MLGGYGGGEEKGRNRNGNQGPLHPLLRSYWEAKPHEAAVPGGITGLASSLEEQPSTVRFFSIVWWVKGSFLHCWSVRGNEGGHERAGPLDGWKPAPWQGPHTCQVTQGHYKPSPPAASEDLYSWSSCAPAPAVTLFPILLLFQADPTSFPLEKQACPPPSQTQYARLTNQGPLHHVHILTQPP